MKRKFAVFDIDGTVFRSHLYWEVALSLARNNKLHPKVDKMAVNLYDKWKRRTHDKAFEEFDKRTITILDDVVSELNPQDYDKALKQVLPPLLDQTYLYTKKLIKRLKTEGYFLIAISGSRLEEVNLFASYHGFDDWIGQEYIRTKDGKSYTGKIKKTYKDKHLILRGFVKKHNLTMNDSYAVGDSGGDISMLEQVENPIAFNPNQDLLEYARKAKWKIVVERKSIAYILEDSDGKYILA